MPINDAVHDGTPPDTTPFDHRCLCPVCVSYRQEVRQAADSGYVGGMTDRMADDVRRYLRGDGDEQQALTAF